MGAGLIASLHAASALVKMCGALGIYSHRRTQHSGTSGTESWEEKNLYESAVVLLQLNCLCHSMHYLLNTVLVCKCNNDSKASHSLFHQLM